LKELGIIAPALFGIEEQGVLFTAGDDTARKWLKANNRFQIEYMNAFDGKVVNQS